MSNPLKSSSIFAAMTLISRVLGLWRDIVIANYFSKEQTDIFFAAFRIPNTLRRFFAEGGFANAFVPVLNESKVRQSEAELRSLLDHAFGVLVAILSLITLLGVVFSGTIIAIIGLGFAAVPEKAELAATMLRITFPYILFIALTAFFTGILNTYQRFALPAIVPVFLNISLITGALYFRHHFEPPVLVLAWGVFIGGLLQFVIQIPMLWWLKRLPLPRFDVAHRGVRKVLRLMVPTLLGSSAGQINILLNTMLASTLVSGSISWLYYSERLAELPIALVGVALGTVILPRLSVLKTQANSRQFSNSLTWAFRVAFLLGSAAATGLIVLALPIITTLLSRGQFGIESTEMTAKSLMFFAVGGFFLILIKVLTPGFYSHQNTKTPAKIAIFSIVINILMALSLYRSLGHVGLAMASTLASAINAMLLTVLLVKSGRLIINRDLLVFMLRVAIANLAMAGVLWMGNHIVSAEHSWADFTQIKRMISLVVLILSGLLAYILALLFLRIKTHALLRPPV